MEFDQLLEHLDDLVDLARHEGYVAFAVQLANFRVAANYNRGAFDLRAPTPDAAPVSARDVEAAIHPSRDAQDS